MLHATFMCIGMAGLMKIRRVLANNHRREFSVLTRSGAQYTFPYAKAIPSPAPDDPIEDLFVDKELGSEAFTYVLHSGKEASVHLEQVLEYNEDPAYLADVLTYRLTVEARKRIDASSLSRRQLAKRLSTSVPQLYRLLDPANSKKSLRQLIALLHVLDCEVDFVVRRQA